MTKESTMAEDQELSNNKKDLIPSKRSINDDLELFDAFIDSQIHKYLNDGFVQNDNANARKSFSGMVNSVSQFDFRRNALRDLYKHVPEAVRAHEVGMIHIHDLWTSRFCGYCGGWNLRQILLEGLDLVIKAKPASHLQTVFNHLINFIVTAQREWAGAMAFSDIDVLLAPFIRVEKLSYKEVKQDVQSFVFNLNFPTRYGDQPPFVNITVDLQVPERYKGVPAIVGGKEMSFTHDQCEEEMNMINTAFFEILMEGDGAGSPFTFPIPTVAIDKTFDYGSDIAQKLMTVTALRGSPYFLNYNVDYLKPDDNLAMCCRLRLNYEELQKHSGGIWSIGENTGSIGVVSINMPRIGFITATNGSNLYNSINTVLEIARQQLKYKRKVITESLETGLLPATKKILCNKFDYHFNTIGIVGMHDFCMNMIGKPIFSNEGQDLTIKVLRYIRKKIETFQVEDEMLYNLEQTPAEKTAGRFAYEDYKYFGKDAGLYFSIQDEHGNLEYTNSTHLPVDYDGLVEKIDIEGKFHEEFTGGCITHLFMDSISNVESLTKFVKRVAENSNLSYFTLTPTLSVCVNCKKTMIGTFVTCPTCNSETDIWSRVTGYYRPVKAFNPAKQAEFRIRKHYIV